MADIIGVTLPVRFHLREKVGPINTLGLPDSILNQIRLFTIQLVVICAEETIEPRCNAFNGFVLRGVRLSQRGDSFSLKIRQRRIDSSSGKRLVHRQVRWQIDVGRAVVTINAIHFSLFSGRNLIGT